MKYVVLLGRILFSMIFILASFSHFSKATILMASQYGIPMAGILVPLSGILSFLGGISILLGYRAKIGAWLIIAFLAPVTFMMHQFWEHQDPINSTIEKIMFMKNLSMLGCALLLTYFGSGPLSLKK